MKGKSANLHASVLTRLRHVARAKNSDYQLILRRYAIERLLYRLSITPQRHQFILKGAMLFTAWLEDPFRPTQDLDLLGHGDPATSSIEAAFLAICQVETDDDGLMFDTDGLRVETIREDQQYGVHIKTVAFLGKPRIPVQVDIGFGDAITPAAEELEFPSLLAPKGPRLKAYPKETVVAEKLQAIVSLGLANSRMKDFYGLLALLRLFEFDGRILVSAIRATFERRERLFPWQRQTVLVTDSRRTMKSGGNGWHSSAVNHYSLRHRTSKRPSTRSDVSCCRRSRRRLHMPSSISDGVMADRGYRERGMVFD